MLRLLKWHGARPLGKADDERGSVRDDGGVDWVDGDEGV